MRKPETSAGRADEVRDRKEFEAAAFIERDGFRRTGRRLGLGGVEDVDGSPCDQGLDSESE